jgi:hypothetical protein
MLAQLKTAERAKVFREKITGTTAARPRHRHAPAQSSPKDLIADYFTLAKNASSAALNLSGYSRNII